MSPATSERPKPATSETSIRLRLSKPLLDLITRAATTVGKSRTEFMLESARQHAIDELLDQRLLRLDDEQYAAFVHALDNPPPPNSKLRKLLSDKAPWEA